MFMCLSVGGDPIHEALQGLHWYASFVIEGLYYNHLMPTEVNQGIEQAHVD